MSNIKDLFKYQQSQKLLGNATLNKIGRGVESPDYVRSNIKDKRRFLPHVDFTSASNFAIYGSAQSYFEDSINYIINEYPYDGSQKEKINWSLSGTYLDKWIFENEYPRTNGFVTIGLNYGTSTPRPSHGYYASSTDEYISFKGGPHKSDKSGSIRETFSTANIYNTASKGLSNLEVNGDKGISLEFWLNKKDWDKENESKRQVIFDLWNNTGFNEDAYGRFRVELVGNPDTELIEKYFDIELYSGSHAAGNGSGWSYTPTKTLTTFALSSSVPFSGSWNHFALTFANTGSEMVGKLYRNGVLESTIVRGSSMGQITGSMLGYVGALTAPVSGVLGTSGSAKLSASLDDLRYWKVDRTSEQIGRNWFTNVDGGTNTDITLAATASTKYSYENPADLGLYYKFNEGVVNSTSTNNVDSTVLDYAGSITNGEWTGYAITARSTGSAMVLSGKAKAEFKDPILYSNHPDVSRYVTYKNQIGKLYDSQNNSSIYSSLPSWITSDDKNIGSGDLKKLTQIVASYFDTLQLQIGALPNLKNKEYVSGSDKPIPFVSRFLDSSGLISSEIFSKAKDLEYLASRDDTKNYSDKIDEAKNFIYQNIYNNLIYIYKSKGTEKAFRNLIRCFGVGRELVNINLYADNAEYEIQNNVDYSVVRKKYADFYSSNRVSASVFQNSSSINSDSRSSISANSSSILYRGNTYECEAIFPKDQSKEAIYYFPANFQSASIFGVHTSGSDNLNHTTWGHPDYGNFQVHAIRKDTSTPDAYFQLSGTNNFQLTRLTSSLFKDVYDDTKWNFAVKIKPSTYPWVDGVSGSALVANKYDLHFEGYNYVLDYLVNSFVLTASIEKSNAQNFLSSSKRFFVGAHTQDFTGTVLQHSNVKASSLRVWMDYLTGSVIEAHAKDVLNFGTLNPYKSAYITEQGKPFGGNFGGNITSIPQMETLALNWDFGTLTSSNASGQFVVEDISSGSISSPNLTSRWDWLGNITKYQHTGLGYNFPANDTGSIDRRYVHTAKQQLPEVINSSDMISSIGENRDKLFTRDTRPEQYYFAFEKSMYNVISEEMLKIFATIVDFNNIIGEPVNRYRQEYKDMEKLRSLWFERVRKVASLEKFVEFYKWIDSALSIMLQQITPASARFSENLRTMVESHVLERNKYWTKFPTLEMKVSDPEAGLFGITELLYPWKLGTSPVPNSSTGSNCFWWKNRTERGGLNITSGDSTIDNQRDTIKKISWFRSGSGPRLATSRDSTSSTTTYEGSTYAVRNFTKHYRFTIKKPLVIHGGDNYSENKKSRLIINDMATHYGQPSSVTPRFQITDKKLETFGEGIGTENKNKAESCVDIIVPNEKKRVDFKLERDTSNGGASEHRDYISSKGSIIAPFSMYSSSVVNGYQSSFTFGKFDLTNYHNDSYGIDNEIPIQGPFTNEHVGGRQYRHQGIVTSSEDKGSLQRAEGWETKIESNKIILQPTPSNNNNSWPFAIYLRDETAKRPVNIRNIKWGTSSAVAGNFRKNYEVIQTSGRKANNRFFVKNSGFIPFTASSTFITGIVDYAIPRNDLTGTDIVFVERFSAPGGPEIMGRGALDIYSGEYSAYNALPWRNYLVRSTLRDLHTLHCGQFGINPTGVLGDTTTADEHKIHELKYKDSIGNYHKVNRNSRKIALLSKEGTLGSPARSSSFDNWFVQHPIPQSAFQYAWITASVSQSTHNTFGYVSNFSTPSGATSQTQSSLPFATNSVHAAGGINVDFVGINTLIYDPIDYSKLLLTSSNGEYKNTKIATVEDEFNSLLLHRNGPYQYPSWKQVRTGEHPIARFQKKRNLMSVGKYNQSIELSAPPPAESNKKLKIQYLRKKPDPNKIFNWIEPPVTFNKPLESTFVIDGTKRVTLRHTYANNKCTFTQRGLVSESIGSFLGIGEQKSDFQIYDKFQKSNVSDQIYRTSYSEIVYPRSSNVLLARTRGRINYAEKDDGRNFNGTENRDPTLSNDYTKNLGSNGIDRGPLSSRGATTARGRRTFWRNSIKDRNRRQGANEPAPTKAPNVSASLYNSQGHIDQFATSLYCLGNTPMVFGGGTQHGTPPSRGTATTYTMWNDTSEIKLSSSFIDFGELNSANYVTISGLHASTSGSSAEPYLVSQSAFLPTASCYYYHFDISTETSGFSNFSFFNPGILRWVTAVSSGVNPWFDSYDDYANDIRGLAKDYTIIPEFNVSEHMEYYSDSQNGAFNFQKQNDKFLSLDGGVMTSSATDVTGTQRNVRTFNSNFFNEYSNTDFQKYFGKFETENQFLNKISLRCDGVKKLLPYMGFYPQHRTLQLASLFSQSIGPHIGGIAFRSGSKDSRDGNYLGAPHAPSSGALAVQSLLQPYYAPGIMYNTIKSGLACDWAAYTGSTAFSSSYGPAYIKWVPDYKIPFESILNPISEGGKNSAGIMVSRSDGKGKLTLLYPTFQSELKPNSVPGFSQPRVPFVDIDSVGVRNCVASRKYSLYKKAINNFFAEIPNFYLSTSKLKTITSDAEEGNVILASGSSYYMDIVLYKDPDLVMIEDYYNGKQTLSSVSVVGYEAGPVAGQGLRPGDVARSYNGRYFGPALKSGKPHRDDGNTYKWGDSPNRVSDPCWAPYTPPYFYGKSKVTIKYKADADDEEGLFSYQKMFNKCLRGNVSDGKNGPTECFMTSSNPEMLEMFKQLSGPYTDRKVDAPALSGAMSISSSINLFGLEIPPQLRLNENLGIEQVVDDQNRARTKWVISPKMETPVLDFSNQDNDFRTSDNPYITPPDAGGQRILCGRGMWSGYGKQPKGRGIVLGIEETEHGSRGYDEKITGSLIQQCFGNNPRSVKIGELANSKVISEAIIAIPFVRSKPSSKFAKTTRVLDRLFFGIEQLVFNKYYEIFKENENSSKTIPLTEGGFSIQKMLSLMSKYVIPPELDFLSYIEDPDKRIDPFVMYIFEFNHKLLQKDLSHIWQGIMPKIAQTAELSKPLVDGGIDNNIFEHPIGPQEFFHGLPLPPKVRWMIFKVKRRAAYDYYNITANKLDDAFSENFDRVSGKVIEPAFSYNWPYDFCSLVELAKIEAKNDFVKGTISTPEDTGPTKNSETSTTTSWNSKTQQGNVGNQTDPNAGQIAQGLMRGRATTQKNNK